MHVEKEAEPTEAGSESEPEPAPRDAAEAKSWAIGSNGAGASGHRPSSASGHRRASSNGAAGPSTEAELPAWAQSELLQLRRANEELSRENEKLRDDNALLASKENSERQERERLMQLVQQSQIQGPEAHGI